MVYKLAQIFYNRNRPEDIITEYWDKDFETNLQF